MTTYKSPKKRFTDLDELHSKGKRQAPDLFVADLRKKYKWVPNAPIHLLMLWWKQDREGNQKK